MDILLEAKEIYKSFGGHEVLRGVNLKVREGTIHALIGPNGAGKTTLLNIINGLESPNRGKILFQGKEITSTPVEKRAKLGLARTFQLLEIFSGLSVLENVMVALYAQRPWGMWKSLILGEFLNKKEKEIKEEAASYLEEVNLLHRAKEEAQNLPAGEQKLLEIARALAINPKILLLDEPAAGLNNRETQLLGETLRMICQKRGVTILLVEHDMDLVMRISDFITVLNFGEILAEGTPLEIQRNPQVIKAYLGEET